MTKPITPASPEQGERKRCGLCIRPLAYTANEETSVAFCREMDGDGCTREQLRSVTRELAASRALNEHPRNGTGGE